MNKSNLVTLVVILTLGLLVLTVPNTAKAAGVWYVAPGGSDGNACTSAGTACASINGALGKLTFSGGDTVRVATGTYPGSGSSVVLISKNVNLSGGWDATFTNQTGTSTIDGQNARRGIKIVEGVTSVTIERFTIENGHAQVDFQESGAGGGIETWGAAVTINNSTLQHNYGQTMGGGISGFNGNITLQHTTVYSNTSDGGGAGIRHVNGTLTLDDATISENFTWNGTSGVDSMGELVITNSLITGNGSPAGGGSGVFNNGTTTVSDSTFSENHGFMSALIVDGTAELDNVTVENNQAGGITNQGVTTIMNSMIRSNLGSGVSNSGELSISNSTITDNHAPENHEGGGIRNFGQLTLDHVVVSNNSAKFGGGIFVYTGGVNSADIRDSSITGNIAVVGGGIDNGHIVSVLRTTISNNQALSGGGIANHDTLTVENSTLSGNTASGGFGGGIYADGGTTKLYNATITANSAVSKGRGGGIHQSGNASVELANTILSKNQGFFSADCFGKLTSMDYNLIDVSAKCKVALQPHDQVGKDSMLGPLASNGGINETHALFRLSSAVDKGDPNGCKDHSGVLIAIDQRGTVRMDGDGKGGVRCDVGAFEFDPAVCANVVPEVPTLVAPAAGDTLIKNQVDLQWAPQLCATEYRLVVRGGSLNKTATVVNSHHNRKGLEYGTKYKWRLAACNDATCGPETGWKKFKVAPLTTGTWQGVSSQGQLVRMNVDGNNSVWNSFLVNVSFPKCTVRLTAPGPALIKKGKLQVGGALGGGTLFFSGTFKDTTHVTGKYVANNVVHPYCGTFTETGTWAVEWVSPTMSAARESQPANPSDAWQMEPGE